MIDLSNATHHPVIEEIVDVLCHRIRNTDRTFFRVEAAFFLSKMASSMRAVILTKDRGEVPVNAYAIALATSGFGKGHSISILENEFLVGFKKKLIEDTIPVLGEKHMWDLAHARAARSGKTEQDEYNALEREWRQYGAFPFTFDDATPAAVKQLRGKLLLAGAGALTLQIDEIGSNLLRAGEVLPSFLELYDQGMIKQKLTKNTAENQRHDEVDGKTPTNMLLFGTPSKLFDGTNTEKEFYALLETGYARRCIFANGLTDHRVAEELTAAEIYQKQIQPQTSNSIAKLSNQFHMLADAGMHNWKMVLEDDVAIKLVEYLMACEDEAAKLPEHEEIRKAELSHRYFKALKIAGAFAFVDLSSNVEMDHLMSAILLVEESGKSFESILRRDKAYVRLAKYIADTDAELTHADLVENLPFYSRSGKNEMMGLATAWGYKNNIIIKKSFVDGIEFFKGETLKETNLNELILSHSNHWAYNYSPELAPFDELHNLAVLPDWNWCNHNFSEGHRNEENVILGFNTIVIDCDGGIRIDTVQELLKETKHFIYTTKRHDPAGDHRFRLVIPMRYHLELDSEDYRDFMNAFMAWLPFKTDESANQRSKKWLTNEHAQCFYNVEGELLDIRGFIPKTSRYEQNQKAYAQLENLDNLERWFAQRIAMGNRNTHMIKFTLALVDSGIPLIDVTKMVHAFNKKLNNPLPTEEIDSTVLVTAAKKSLVQSQPQTV